MARQHAAPFDTTLLTASTHANIADLLPATIRTSEDDIIATSSSDSIAACLRKELLVERLDAIQSSLWMAGRPMPPRHLGYQQVLSREIILVEQMDLHLVWKDKRIFIKALPKFLLDEAVWAQHLSTASSHVGSNTGPGQISQVQGNASTPEEKLASCARGFLVTYCALIAYESDFRLAKAIGLIPEEISWQNWRSWTREVLQNCHYNSLNSRFWYGELRLGRLNKIYRWRKGAFIRGYSRVGSPSVYGELLSEHFATLAAILGYIVIVLTAMQVGLATDHLQSSATFQDASWGFTVFSIISPLAAVGLIFGLFLIMFLGNWMATLSYEKARFDHMGVGVQVSKEHNSNGPA